MARKGMSLNQFIAHQRRTRGEWTDFPRPELGKGFKAQMAKKYASSAPKTAPAPSKTKKSKRSRPAAPVKAKKAPVPQLQSNSTRPSTVQDDYTKRHPLTGGRVDPNPSTSRPRDPRNDPPPYQRFHTKQNVKVSEHGSVSASDAPRRAGLNDKERQAVQTALDKKYGKAPYIADPTTRYSRANNPDRPANDHNSETLRRPSIAERVLSHAANNENTSDGRFTRALKGTLKDAFFPSNAHMRAMGVGAIKGYLSSAVAGSLTHVTKKGNWGAASYLRTHGDAEKQLGNALNRRARLFGTVGSVVGAASEASKKDKKHKK